jgi:hypothetical protein
MAHIRSPVQQLVDAFGVDVAVAVDAEHVLRKILCRLPPNKDEALRLMDEGEYRIADNVFDETASFPPELVNAMIEAGLLSRRGELVVIAPKGLEVLSTRVRRGRRPDELVAHHRGKEAADRVRLPAGCLHDRRDGCALSGLQHRDQPGLLRVPPAGCGRALRSLAPGPASVPVDPFPTSGFLSRGGTFWRCGKFECPLVVREEAVGPLANSARAQRSAGNNNTD